MSVNILIAEDHGVVRTGIRTLVEGTDIHVTGEENSGNQAVQPIPQLKPQVGVRMRDGLNTLGRIRVARKKLPILQQVASVLTNKEIAVSLRISFETAKEHIQHILRKTGVSDRTRAAAWEVRKELFQKMP